MSDPDQFTDPVDGTRWRVDLDFLASNWTCIWGAGCVGIGDHPDPEAGLGCCSVGAAMLDEDEAMLTAALAATLDPDRFQFADAAVDGGVLVDDRSTTRVVDGACIFLNRPGFSGGAGCALHLAAVHADESPVDWKPAVCWQLPLKVDRETGPDGTTAVLRRWTRDDWGPDGATMAWCCTDGPAGDGSTAYAGDRPVIESLAAEVRGLVGPDVADAVAVAIRRR